MGRLLRAGLALAIGSAMGLAIGCDASGGGASPEGKVERFRESVLGEVGQMLRIREKDTSRPPSTVKDLAKYQPGFPSGFQKVQGGDVVLMLGAPVEDGASDKVLAFEKQAPDSGGYVLMQDGTTVKKMSAEEFQAAPKAAGTPTDRAAGKRS
jgi:hypothetical protein